MSSLPLPRLAGWPERFIAFLESRRHSPFVWGSNDCALFAADGVLSITGVDFAADWRGYTTEREALDRIRKAGGMRGFVSYLIERVPLRGARGEVALAELDGRETFGLIAGNGHWCGPGANGLIFRPLREVIAVFGY